MHEPFFVSFFVVAVAEIGDRTQLLTLLLAARYRKPWQIVLGILLATVANHAVAGFAGQFAGSLLTPELLRWSLGISFIAMAAWALVPDKLSDDGTLRGRDRGAFLVTLTSFFIAEIGDKTQIATAALAARFDHLLPVVAGTTLGMLAANVPVVILAQYAGHRINGKWARYVAAAIFACEGVLTLIGVRLF
jgi:putative Ca2+/H+ antiporter (TMEM165/GDT1 family)